LLLAAPTAPSQQDGFEVIQALNSTAAMAAFVKRILLEERGDVKQNDQGMARYFDL